jgi:hypothetical protein
MRFFLLMMVACIVSMPVLAEEAANAVPQNADQVLEEQTSGDADTKTAEAPAAEEKKPQESPDMIAKKVELAKKMHQIRPTREQIDSAIDQASRGMPEEQRKAFLAAMRSVLNYNAIEKISVDAMVDTFTLPEMEAMVEYHTKPEAQSVAEKMPVWASKVQPEIVRMIDSAIMRVKTGSEK